MAIGADKVRPAVTMTKDMYDAVKQVAELKDTDATELMRQYIKHGLASEDAADQKAGQSSRQGK